MPCFICGSEDVLMEVTAFTSFGAIHYDICEDDYVNKSDGEASSAVLTKAIKASGVSLPVDIAKVPEILRQAGLMDKEPEPKPFSPYPQCACSHAIKDHDEDSGHCLHPGCICQEPERTS